MVARRAERRGLQVGASFLIIRISQLFECPALSRRARHFAIFRNRSLVVRRPWLWVPDRARRPLVVGAGSVGSLVRDDDGWFQLSNSHASTASQRAAPESCIKFVPLQTEGAGKAGRAKRTRSLMCKLKKAHELVTTGSPVAPGLPCATVLTVSFVLSPVTGLSCHRHLQDHRLASLISASGYQDHTTSPSAFSAARLAKPTRPSHPAQRS
jgi:hypothetical protein